MVEARTVIAEMGATAVGMAVTVVVDMAAVTVATVVAVIAGTVLEARVVHATLGEAAFPMETGGISVRFLSVEASHYFFFVT